MPSAPLLPESLAAVVILGGASLGYFRPRWFLPATLLLLPWQIPVFSLAHLATLFLAGGALSRAPDLARFVLARPAVAFSLLLMPALALLSGLWARQPAFVMTTARGWGTLSLAALLAASGPRTSPRIWLLAIVGAAIPASGWALAEHLHLIELQGDPELNRYAGINLRGVVRGRGLFHHPNKLAEFLEPLTIILTAFAAAWFHPALAISGILGCIAGLWATGSWAGFGLAIAFSAVTAALVLLPRFSRRQQQALSASATAGGLAVLAYAYQGHGGLGPRNTVFQFAADLIALHPWLGIGAGNWPLFVASAPIDISRFWFGSHPHSLYLMIGAELGLLGLCGLVIAFGVPLIAALRTLHQSDPTERILRIGAAGGVAALLAHGLVNYPLRYPINAITWGLLLGLAIGNSRTSRPADDQSSKEKKPK